VIALTIVGIALITVPSWTVWMAWLYYVSPGQMQLPIHVSLSAPMAGGALTALGMIPAGIVMLAGLYAATKLVQLGDQE